VIPLSNDSDSNLKICPSSNDDLLMMQSRLTLSQDLLTKKLIELTRTRFYLDALLAHISQGLIFIDTTGIIVTLSKRALELLQLESELITYPVHHSSLFQDEFFGFSIQKLLEKKGNAPLSILTLLSQSSLKKSSYLEISASSIHLENKALSELNHHENVTEGLLILIRDVSEIEHLQAIQQRSERLRDLGEVTAIMAHEIRNPLSAIEGFASLLKRDLNDHFHQHEMAESIVEAARTINQKLTQVLHYAKPLKPLIHNQCVRASIQQAIEMVHVSQWLRSDQKLLWDESATLLIPHDRELLKSALLHLFRNASQAIPAKGTIEIKTKEILSHIEIHVIDDGVGIEACNLEKIFLPLFTTKDEGNGLGLCEVNKMIHSQGGSVEVLSLIRFGSVFIIKLPILSHLTSKGS
jgi:signal transduction histidine kinase